MKNIFLLMILFNFIFASFLDNLKTFSADFSQIIDGEIGAASVKYEGELIASNNNAKWTYNTPIKKEIYINNGKVFIYEPMMNEVIISNIDNNLDFLNLLRNLKKVENEIYKGVVEDIEYVLIFKDNLPYNLNYIDGLGNRVNIFFKNVKINEIINSSLFEFIIPNDADIIETK